MRSYVVLANWTDQGAKNIRETLKRAKAFRALIENRGGKLREHLYTLGEYDIVMVTEFPDDETAAAAVMALAALGNVRVKTMRAFTDEETAGIIPQLGLVIRLGVLRRGDRFRGDPAPATSTSSVSVPPEPGRQRKLLITNHHSTTRSDLRSRTCVLITASQAGQLHHLRGHVGDPADDHRTRGHGPRRQVALSC